MRWPRPVLAVAAVVAPAGVAAAFVLLRSVLDNTNVALAVAVVVVVAAISGGLVAGGLASISAAVAFDLLQTKPYGSLRIAGTRDTITTVLLLVVGLLAGALEERRRAGSRRDADQGQDFAHLQRFSRVAAAGGDPEDLITTAEAELADLLGLVDCRFEPFPFESTLARLVRPSSGRHRLVLRREDVDPAWGPDEEVELPVEARGHQIARFVLQSRPGWFPLLIPRQTREVAFALADRLGAELGPGWASADWQTHHPHSVG